MRSRKWTLRKIDIPLTSLLAQKAVVLFRLNYEMVAKSWIGRRPWIQYYAIYAGKYKNG
jgi:hypothetical protein